VVPGGTQTRLKQARPYWDSNRGNWNTATLRAQPGAPAHRRSPQPSGPHTAAVEAPTHEGQPSAARSSGERYRKAHACVVSARSIMLIRFIGAAAGGGEQQDNTTAAAETSGHSLDAVGSTWGSSWTPPATTPGTSSMIASGNCDEGGQRQTVGGTIAHVPRNHWSTTVR